MAQSHPKAQEFIFTLDGAAAAWSVAARAQQPTMPVVDYPIGGVGWLAPGGVGWLARGTGNGRSGRSSGIFRYIAHCQQTVAHGRKEIRPLFRGLLQDVLSNNYRW